MTTGAGLLGYGAERMRPYHEAVDKSAQIAEAVLAETHQRNLPPNPIHYTIWYEYLLKRDPYVVERMLANDPYEELVPELFKHIVSRICVIDDIDCLVLKLVNEIITDMLNWEGDLTHKTKTLEDALSTLSERQHDANLATSVIKNVVASVRELTLNANTMQHKMEDVRNEVKTLKKQLEMSHKEAHTDPLTSVGNRRAMDKFLAENIGESVEHFSCIILDIDYFKRINDQYGHLVGDSVLRFIAKHLRRMSKGQDFIARFGGEEFILLLPETDLAHAYQFAEKLRKQIQLTRFTIKDSKETLTFTVSMGVATYHRGELVSDFIDRADNALYMAKGTGRNRVVDEIEASRALHLR